MSNEMKKNREYLGDGLYAEFDGLHFVLSTERDSCVTHWVSLDTVDVLPQFLKYVEKICGVHIKISKSSNEGESK